MNFAELISVFNIDGDTLASSLRSLIIIYFIVANIFGFLIMLVDKKLAIKRKRRISEANLFLTGICGGAIGVWFSMYSNRHKTLKNKFRFGIPFLVILNTGIYMYLMINIR
ncbi:MAG: DUF1294 domain-containing protein [Proteocatella sp.]